MRTARLLNDPPRLEQGGAPGRYPVVGMFAPGYPASRMSNGISSYTAAIVKGMREIGVTAHVLAGEITAPPDGTPVVQVPEWSAQHSAAHRLAVRIGRRVAPDVLHDTTWADSIVCGIRLLQQQAGIEVFEMEESFGLARLVARRVDLPIVVRMHGPWFVIGPLLGKPRDAAYRKRVRNERAGVISAAGLTGPSRDVINRVRAYYGLELPDAEVIPNSTQPVPSKLHWSWRGSDRNRILFVGRFDRIKGADILLQAFARVLQGRPDARLTIVGPEGKIVDEHGVECTRAHLMNRHLPQAAQQSVEWLGVKTQAEVQALRKTCALCVVASRYETFSMTALEAMAAGCPVVATDVGGLPEMLQHERNGLLCRAEDPADMAEKILRVLRQPALATTIAKQGLVDVDRRYHPHILARQTLDFYRRVVERYRRANTRSVEAPNE